MHHILQSKSAKLFSVMSAFFIANALIANCIGSKIFNLEETFGFVAHPFTLFGENNLTFALTCGVILWPIEFVMTDIVNEYFGPKAVRRISFTAIALISYAFIMFYLAQATTPAGWWIVSNEANGVPDMQKAFSSIFGQSRLIIVGSLAAFMVSQLIDVHVFHKIKKITGEKKLWLRATGSTVVSQFVDSFIVLYIAFVLPGAWSWQKLIAIGCVNYAYKFCMAIILTPVIGLAHKLIDNYVGNAEADALKKLAMQE
jgi:queuosine precursor transporter